MSYVGVGIVVIGCVFSLAAAIGVLRFPDVYTRMHAASKAGPLGAGLVLLGAAVDSADLFVVVRALVGIAFLLATAPLAAHLLGRSAVKSGIMPVTSTSKDQSSRRGAKTSSG